MNDDQSKDHELTESLLETSPKASTNPESILLLLQS